MKKIRSEHDLMAEQLAIALQDAGFDTELICETEITDEHALNKDLCISFGGNNTFLKTAMHVKDANRTSIYGIRSIPSKETCGMCEAVVEYGNYES